MRYLIDGYNLMHAAGLGPGSGAGGVSGNWSGTRLRKSRERFLNFLRSGLEEDEAASATVVFDASRPPPELPESTRHQGIRVVFAAGRESADALIEEILEEHPNARGLTVVSSDQRVRFAARRAKARGLRSEEFLEELSATREAKARRAAGAAAGGGVAPGGGGGGRRGPSREEVAREEGLTEAETREWLAAFGELEADPEVREHLEAAPSGMIGEEDIERIAREVEAEFARLEGPRGVGGGGSGVRGGKSGRG